MTSFNTIDINNITLSDVNFHKKDPENIFNVRPITWCNRFKQHKECKKEISKELMSVT